MVNNGYSSINILLLTLCYLSALFLVHKIVYQLALILFGRFWSRSSKFGRFWSHFPLII